MYYIIAFRARSQTINFARILNSYKVACEIINTPRIINVSCGISIKFMPKDLIFVKNILKRRNFDTYAGIFLIEGYGFNYRAKLIEWYICQILWLVLIYLLLGEKYGRIIGSSRYFWKDGNSI